MSWQPSEGIALRAACKQIKLRLNNILHCRSPYCSVCLVTDKPLCGLNDLIDIRSWVGEFTTTLRQIMVTLFGEMHLKIEYLCVECKTEAVKAYIFIHNARQSADVLENYIQQIEGQINCIAEADFNDNANAVMVLEDPQVIDAGSFETESESDSDNKQNHQRNGLSTKDISKKLLECTECDNEKECIHHQYLVACGNQRISGETKILCPSCNYQCWSKERFINHINKVHLSTPSIVCEYCSKPHYSKYSYKTHITNFHREMLFCEYCNGRFKYKHNLAKHKETCNSKCNKQFLCDSCCGTFASERKFEYHKRKYHSGVLKYPCSLCQKSFATVGLLTAHRRVHIDSKFKPRRQYECGICHSYFQTLKERNKHKLTHDDKDRCNCKMCGLEFESQSAYCIHMASKHYPKEKHKSYKCTLCEYETTARVFLEAHVNRFHLKIRPYPCTQCPKKFVSTVKLNVHLKTHNPVKTYSCDQCGNIFCGPMLLKKHMRLHTGEKPYGCTLCDRKFICASTRNAHMARKHKPKTIECPICESLFHTISMLRAHIKGVHWKSKEKFDVTKVEGLKEEHYDIFKDRRFEIPGN